MSSSDSSYRTIISVLTIFVCATALVYCTSQQPDSQQSTENDQEVQKANEDTPELADAMGQLQYYLHKYALAVEAENHELANFYFHEVEAASNNIKENIPSYEGYDITRFMSLFLDPTIEPIETTLADKNWEEVREKTITMVDACNSCHNATAHGFVKVTPGFDNNPYNQDFSVSE